MAVNQVAISGVERSKRMRPAWENQGALHLVHFVNFISLQSRQWLLTPRPHISAGSWDLLLVGLCCAGAKAPKAHRHALRINSSSSSACIGSSDHPAQGMFCGTRRRPSRHGLRHSGCTPMPSERRRELRSERLNASRSAPLGNTEREKIRGCTNNLRGLAFAEAGEKPLSSSRKS